MGGLDFLLWLDLILWFPDTGGAVGKEDSIQVVDLVLEDARQPTFGFYLHRLSMPVHSFYRPRDPCLETARRG